MTDFRWLTAGESHGKGLAAIVEGEGSQGSDPVHEVQRSYDEGVTDEFIEPIVFADRPQLAKDDSVKRAYLGGDV